MFHDTGFEQTAVSLHPPVRSTSLLDSNAAALLPAIMRVSIMICTLANFRHMHVNILLGPAGVKAQSTHGWRNGICQPLNGALGRMKADARLVV